MLELYRLEQVFVVNTQKLEGVFCRSCIDAGAGICGEYTEAGGGILQELYRLERVLVVNTQKLEGVFCRSCIDWSRYLC